MTGSRDLVLRHSVVSDVGRVRTNNEDSHASCRLPDGSLLLVVADGMGGHEAGEVASGLAVQVIEDAVCRDLDRDPRDRIYHALLEANAAIREEGRRSNTRGMGTTSVVALCQGDEVHVGLVGDSRCYHLRHGKIVWRTVDHTRVQDLVDQGQIDAEAARNHPEAGMLTRALGHEKMANGRPLVPDVLAEPIMLEQGDALVLCSDGLHDLMEDWELGGFVAGNIPGAAASALVELARERGGHDNITVAVVVAGDRAGELDDSYEPPPPHVEADQTYDGMDAASDAPPPVAAVEFVPEPQSKRPFKLWWALAAVGVLAVLAVLAVLVLLAVGVLSTSLVGS